MLQSNWLDALSDNKNVAQKFILSEAWVPNLGNIGLKVEEIEHVTWLIKACRVQRASEIEIEFLKRYQWSRCTHFTT